MVNSQILEQALARETNDNRHELAATAQGLTKAAEILAGRFTLVATNVPYLGRGKQSDTVKHYLEQHYRASKADLATAFVERCLEFCAKDGTTALVTPQNWLFLTSYTNLRKSLLEQQTWNLVVQLGSNAFRDMNWWAATTALISISCGTNDDAWVMSGIDVSGDKEQDVKASRLANRLPTSMQVVRQFHQLRNPDARIELGDTPQHLMLSVIADAYRGQGTGDTNRFICCYWEVQCGISQPWIPLATSPERTTDFGGCSQAILWEDGRGQLAQLQNDLVASGMPKDGWKRGWPAWGALSVRVAPMNQFPASLHEGSHFDSNCAVIVPRDPSHLPAIWCFCSSAEFRAGVRAGDQSTKVTSNNLVKIPFDLPRWRLVAAEKYPSGLPKPHSDDPTQWLFNGHPKGSEQPLQVAVARLLGYRWPRQTGSQFPDCPALGPDGLEDLADADGIVCLPPINKEQPAAARLRSLLAAALGADWSPSRERDLLTATGARQTNLEDWLRDAFFEQHCKLFKNRPFVWHIWDGRKDGFHALVNYHRLDHANLQKLTYSYLGDWIRQQDADAKADKPGAAERLGAAQALEAELIKILEGEPPYDLFIRWKPIQEQPLGWQPDLNDGVRLNIRPFMLARDVGKKGAGILRAKPNIKWDKDRGKEPHRDKADYPWFWHETEPPLSCPGGPEFTGNRWNNVHLTLARKRAARQGQGGS